MSKLGGEGAANALLEEVESKSGGLGTSRNEPSRQMSDSQSPMSGELEHIVKPDGSRYLSSDFWSRLSGEVGGLKQLLDEPSDDEADADFHSMSSPSTNSPFPDTHFVFGTRGQMTSLRSLHPFSSQIAILTDIYFTNVDPLFKVLHRPTCQAKILAAADTLGSTPIDSGLEALMFAMYMLAVISLTDEGCLRQFGQEREKLIAQYKYGTEAALANADFLSSLELMTLQALTIYLLGLRIQSEKRSTWTLVALAVRLGHSLELDREASFSSYTPFEAEMRRRLWLEISVLDVRASEDRGSVPMIVPGSFDTRMPSNVDDADLNPLSFTEIPDRIGCTEMTFSLITHESAMFARHNVLPNHVDGSEDEISKWYRMRAITEEFQARLQAKYLLHCDTTIPFHWVCKTVVKLIGEKLQLLLQYPLQGHRTVPESEKNKEANMILAVDIMEKTNEIERDAHAAQFRWFLCAYVQWHPLAVVLAELCVRFEGPLVERAWDVVHAMFDRLGDRIADSKKGTLWQPLRKLLTKAEAAKARYVKQRQSQAVNPSASSFARGQPVGMGQVDLGPLQLGGVPPISQPPMTMPKQEPSDVGYNPSFNLAPGMDYVPSMDPMDLEGWDDFLKSTMGMDDPSLAQENGDLQWSVPFSMMGSVLP